MIFEGIVKVSLEKPLTWEGRIIDALNLDFGKVNARIMIQAERETFGSGNISPIIRNMSNEYCLNIAAGISGIRYKALEKLCSRDFDSTWQTVAAFLNNKNPQEFYSQYRDDDIELDGDITYEHSEDEPGSFLPLGNPEEYRVKVEADITNG